MKLKAALELDIVRCGYSRQLVHSIFFAIGTSTLVMWSGSLFLSFCLIFSNFPRQREISLVSSSPCCNFKWKYRLDFALHGIFRSEAFIENVLNVSLYFLVSRRWKCHFFKQNLNYSFRLSHLIKNEWLTLSLTLYCLDFFKIFSMFTFQPLLLPTIG